jgi:hypothetical protein
MTSAITPASPADRPARFEAWPADIKSRAFELWSSVAMGSAPRTEYLLAQECGEGVAVPAASTIRMWAAEDGWAARRDDTLAQTHGRTLRQLQANALMQIALAQSTLADAMAGLLDDAPYGGAGRIRAAEATLRLAERSGVVLMRAELDPVPDAQTTQKLTLAQRARLMRERIVEENAQLG